LVLIKGYKESGLFAKAALRAFIDRLGAVGLRIERANALGPYALNALLNRPEGQKEIDNLKRIGELLADAAIPVYGRAYPEAAAYAGTGVPYQTIVPLQYTFPAGQRYVAGGLLRGEYYRAVTLDWSSPGDGTVVRVAPLGIQTQ
jgi:hypothetical protein